MTAALGRVRSGSGDCDDMVVENATVADAAGTRRMRRRLTNPTEIRSAIVKPGDVRINVQGAFIVSDGGDDGQGSNGSNGSNGNDGSNGNNGNNAGNSRKDAGPPETEYEHDSRDIRLPNHTAVVSHVAVDIGGSLVKLVYFSREAGQLGGGRLNFLRFETDRINACLDFLQALKVEHQRVNGGDGKHAGSSSPLCVMATGGGAFKYYDKIRERLGTEVMREDEMECLILGLDFFLSEIPEEVFTYSDSEPMHFVETQGSSDIYPYLLVNIGSGVSIVKVSGRRRYERVGGTSLGGGTLWGLLSLLTGARSFDQMLAMADRGDNAAVDMLVGDIYGMDYGKIGLKSSTIASSFGKVFKMKREAERRAEDSGSLANGDVVLAAPAVEPEPVAPVATAAQEGEAEEQEEQEKQEERDISFKPEDISRSLLYAISNNIGQIAYLHAEKHQLEDIYFGGSFIRGHHQTMRTLSYAIKFWSKGSKQAYFLRHEGYLGAVGAFIKRQPRNWGRRNSLEQPLTTTSA